MRDRKLRKFLGHKFVRYCVSTVARDEDVQSRAYENQETADRQLDQMQLKLVRNPKSCPKSFICGCGVFLQPALRRSTGQ